MEESSNGKTEETQKVYEPLEEYKKVATSVVEEDELKPEFVTVRDIAVDENSELVNEAYDGDEKKETDEKKSDRAVDAGVLDDEEKKLAGIVLEPSKEDMTASEAAAVEKSVNSDVKELEREEIEEKILPASDKTNGVEPVETDAIANGSEETPPLVPPSVPEKDGVESAVVSNETEEERQTSPSNTEGLSPEVADLVSKGIEENVLPTSEENDSVARGLTDVVSKGTEDVNEAVMEKKTGESSTIVDREFKETEEDNAAKQSADATAVGSSDYLLESTANPHLISVSQRTPQPTTFRSCCGLFELLTPSRSRG